MKSDDKFENCRFCNVILIWPGERPAKICEMCRKEFWRFVWVTIGGVALLLGLVEWCIKK